MTRFKSWILSRLPASLSTSLRTFRKTFRGKLDRLIFPFWLIFHCAVRRKKAVIIWRTAALGDIVCTFPLCLEIRKQHPGKLIIYITLRNFKNLVLLSQSADIVHGIDHVYGVRPWVPSLTPFLLGLVAHFYEPLTMEERSGPGVKAHLVDDFATSCGITLTDRQPRLFPSAELIKATRATYGLNEEVLQGRPLIGINGGHTWPVREWDAEKWQAVVDLLHAEYNAVILQFGLNLGPGIPDPYDQIRGVQSLVGRLNSEELVALVAACNLIVSIDSGPVHIAGAVGTPVVGLFGALNPLYRMPPVSPSTAVFTEVPCLFCQHQNPVGHWKTVCT